MKARGAIAILITHRKTALMACDKVLVLAQGTQQRFGPRDQILQVLQRPPSPPGPGLKVVGDASRSAE
jgi:ATP-binding cassette subfamily C protein